MKSTKYFLKSIHLPIQGYGPNPWSRKSPHHRMTKPVCHNQGGPSQTERNKKIKRTRPCTQANLVSNPTLLKLCRRRMQDCYCLDPYHLRWGYSLSLLTRERGSSLVASLMCLPFAWQTEPPFPSPKLCLQISAWHWSTESQGFGSTGPSGSVRAGQAVPGEPFPRSPAPTPHSFCDPEALAVPRPPKLTFQTLAPHDPRLGLC